MSGISALQAVACFMFRVAVEAWSAFVARRWREDVGA